MDTVMQFIIVTVITVLLIYLYSKYFKNNAGIPPGPWGLPIIGYYLFLGFKPVTALSKLADKYGDIMTVNYFGRNYYYLNSIELFKQVVVKEGNHTIDRPEEFNVNSPFGVILSQKSLVTSSGDSWRSLHTFLLSKMTTLGLGKAPFEQKIAFTCDKLIENIKNSNGEPTDFYDLLTNFSFNVINEIIFSNRCECDDSHYIKVRNVVRNFFIFIFGVDGNLSGKLFHFFRRYKSFHKIRTETERYFIPFIEGVLRQRQSQLHSQEYNDLMDFFSEKNSEGDEYYNIESVAYHCFVLFSAGTEVVSMTLNHAINLMILHPNIQQKVQQEIDSVIDVDRQISYQERHLLPYTQAVIQEIQRYACVIPVGIVRSNSKPITVTTNNGHYIIPERSCIIPNIYTVLRDRRHFENPENFDPNNFLNENGDFLKKETQIPFSMGKRMCPGYSLANVELFIAFVTLMQKFQWKSPNGKPVPRIIYEAQARILYPFSCCAIARC